MKKNTSSPPAARPAPQRTCLICRKVKNKKDLMRVVRTREGTVELDLTGKTEGRGAYLCRDRGCWEKLPKGKQLEHALKCEISRGNLEQIANNGKDLLKE